MRETLSILRNRVRIRDDELKTARDQMVLLRNKLRTLERDITRLYKIERENQEKTDAIKLIKADVLAAKLAFWLKCSEHAESEARTIQTQMKLDQKCDVRISLNPDSKPPMDEIQKIMVDAANTAR